MSHKLSGKDTKWQNPSNKIGKKYPKMRRIIKYSFAYSKNT